MSRVAKAIMAFFTTLGTWGTTAMADNGLDNAEWFGLCGVIVATAGVWAIPNTTDTPLADRDESVVGP